MDFTKFVCKHVITPAWARWERSPYLEILDRFQRSQYLSCDQAEALRLERLQAIVGHAYDTTAHYRRSFDEIGVSPRDLQTLDDLQRFPILTKDIYRADPSAFAADGVDRYRKFFTSGSTGKPLSGYWDKHCAELKRAAKLFTECWTGFEIGDPVWCLYGNPLEERSGLAKVRGQLRINLLNRTSYLDLLRLDEAALQDFVAKTRDNQPALIWGHTHGLYALAKYLLANEITSFRPGAAMSAGMPVHDFERQAIEAAFACELFNRYGCEEFGVIAAECPEQHGLHILTDSLMVECVDPEGRPVSPGHPGQILITDLHNRATPFIRYRLEDIVVLSDQTCSCGRHYPLLESIDGRSADFLIATDGALVSGVSLTDHFMMDIAGISQIQLVQDALDHLIVNVVRTADYTSECEQAIGHQVHHFLGSDMAYDIHHLDEIPREASGKFRFSVRQVEHTAWGK